MFNSSDRISGLADWRHLWSTLLETAEEKENIINKVATEHLLRCSLLTEHGGDTILLTYLCCQPIRYYIKCLINQIFGCKHNDAVLNPLYTDRFFHCHMSICDFSGVGSMLLLLFYFW